MRTIDPLSQILSLLKPRSYITAGFDAGGSWGLALDDLAGRIKCYAVIRGSCWLAVAGAAPKKLTEGDCFVLPSGRRATIASDLDLRPKLASEVLDPNRSGEIVTYNGGGDVFLVGSRFEVGDGHSAMMLRTLPPLIRVETSSDQARLRLWLDLMMEELQQQRPGAHAMAQNLSHMILAQTLRLYLANAPATDINWFAALSDARLGRAISAMHAEPALHWTISELAQVAGMSRSSFSQYFRQRTGETPIAYLARWRMLSAGAMLVEGAMNISQVASSFGYTSEPAFNVAFKRIIGQTPGVYAKTLRAQ